MVFASKQKYRKKTSSRLLWRSLKKAGLEVAVYSLSLQETQSKLKEAYNNYYSIKRDPSQLQKSYLEHLTDDMAEEKNEPQAAILKALHERESQRSTARKIRYLRGKMSKSSTMMVMIKLVDGTKTDLTDKWDIKGANMQSNASNSPNLFSLHFYQPPFKQQFGFKGLATAAQAVLAGVYKTYHPLEHHIIKVLDHLETPDGV
jgi:hypothetical protein